MNTQKTILSVQDISCYGKCSNTVMMPVLSAAGLETVMLPTALLSTHTGGFKGFTFLDLTDEMKKIINHWISIGLKFDMLCTGYMGSVEQIDMLTAALPKLMKKNSVNIIDTVLGDNGKLYSIYDMNFVAKMRGLCAFADYITPNLTEACLLAGIDFPGNAYNEILLDKLFGKLFALGAKNVLITGIMFENGEIGIIGKGADGKAFTASSRYVKCALHGTGDVFTASFIAYISRGKDFEAAAKAAEKFVAACIDETEPCIDTHWYGLKFEPKLNLLF